MLLFLLACTLGPPNGATPDSVSAVEAERLKEAQVIAGRLAGTARELEAAAQAAQARIRAGGNPDVELAAFERLMKDIEAMEAALQSAHDERLKAISTAAQSTFEITE